MSVLSGVLGATVMIVLIAVGLRATFGTGRELHVTDPDDPTGDGLLVEITRVPTEAAAIVLQARLAENGIRATVGRDGGPAGYRLLVFSRDEVPAKLLLLS